MPGTTSSSTRENNSGRVLRRFGLASAAGRLVDTCRVSLWLTLTIVVVLVAGRGLVAHTIEDLMRSEAKRSAFEWASYLVDRMPDFDSVVRGAAGEDRDSEVVSALGNVASVFLFKLYDSHGNLRLSSDTTLLEKASEKLSTHNPAAAHAVFSGQVHTVYQHDSGKANRPSHFSEAYVPIMRNGQLRAVVSVYVDQTHRYSAYKAQGDYLIVSIGLIVGIAFALPALFLYRKSRQIARADVELRLQNTRFEGAIESMAHGLSMFDRDDRLIICNGHYREMYGFPPGVAVPGAHLSALLDQAVRNRLLIDTAPVLGAADSIRDNPGQTSVEHTWQLADDRIISVTVSPLPDGGRVAIHKDVTETRRLAARIAESEARFRDFASAASDWCWETDAEHRFSYFTDGFRAATGIDPATVLGKTREEGPIHPEDLEGIRSLGSRLAKHEPFRDFILHARKADGSFACVKSSGAPRFDHDGRFLGYRGTARDVTTEEAHKAELRAAQAALLQRSKQLVEAQRLGKIGDWSYRLGEGQLEWSLELYELLRFDPTQVVSHAAIMERYVGDGAERVVRAQGEIVRTGGIRSVDVKFRRGDGLIRDYVVTSKATYGDNGRVVGFTGTIQDISDRKRAEEQLEKLAYYDPLTGLANRALFTRELDTALARLSSDGNAAALLLLDLDRFKEVNDSLGHSSGDELLVKVGQLISRVLDKGHFLARLGGDEFAIIATRHTDMDSIQHLASRVIDAVSGSILLERGEAAIGTSIGIAMVESGSSTSTTELLRNADLALYRAKEDGRGRFAVFQPEMDATVQYKVVLARDLRRAIGESAGLAVHYQPQIDLKTGQVTGYEALTRWMHPTLGPIPPSEFIAIAESSRLISDLGLWILRQASAQAKAWIDAGEPEREIAVNVSAAQIWHSDFVADVASVLEDTGLPPHLLCLELTESLLADHAEGRVRSALKSLKDLGVTLALDDFGTDYSSLGYLTELPFDKLKIDRVFIDGVARSARARELLKGIVALGHGLGMTVQGEGAENTEEVEILTGFGCDLVQGYVFSRPVAAGAALAFARDFEPQGPNTTAEANPVHALMARLKSAAA